MSVSSVVRLGPALPVRTSHHARGRAGPAETFTLQCTGRTKGTLGAHWPLVTGHTGWSATPGEGSQGCSLLSYAESLRKPKREEKHASYRTVCENPPRCARANMQRKEREEVRGFQRRRSRRHLRVPARHGTSA